MMSDQSDIKNLNYTVACYLKPLLERFVEEVDSYPNSLYHYPDPMAEWRKRLNHMIEAFDHFSKEENLGKPDQLYASYVGLKYFNEHYVDLCFK